MHHQLFGALKPNPALSQGQTSGQQHGVLLYTAHRYHCARTHIGTWCIVEELNQGESQAGSTVDFPVIGTVLDRRCAVWFVQTEQLSPAVAAQPQSPISHPTHSSRLHVQSPSRDSWLMLYQTLYDLNSHCRRRLVWVSLPFISPFSCPRRRVDRHSLLAASTKTWKIDEATFIKIIHPSVPFLQPSGPPGCRSRSQLSG